jgi:hypothetical protein
MRAQPGLGRVVNLWYFTPHDDTDDPRLIWANSLGEDYAQSRSPITIKASGDLSRDEVARLLIELAALIRSAEPAYSDIDPDAPVTVGDFAESEGGDLTGNGIDGI